MHADTAWQHRGSAGQKDAQDPQQEPEQSPHLASLLLEAKVLIPTCPLLTSPSSQDSECWCTQQRRMRSCRLPMGRDPLREEGPGWPSSSTTHCPSSLCFYLLAVRINSREKPNVHVSAAGHTREEAPGTGGEPRPGQASRAGSCGWAQPTPQQPLHLALRAPRTGQVQKDMQTFSHMPISSQNKRIESYCLVLDTSPNLFRVELFIFFFFKILVVFLKAL